MEYNEGDFVSAWKGDDLHLGRIVSMMHWEEWSLDVIVLRIYKYFCVYSY